MRALAVGCLAVLAVQLAAGAAAMNTVCTDKPCPKCAPSDPCVAAGLITCLPFSPTKKGLCYDAQRRKTVSTYRLADIDPEQPTYTYKGVGFYFRAQGQAADCRPKGGLRNAGKNCWGRCGGKQGPCAWCGTGLCCRKGWNDKSNGCDGTIGTPNGHTCVSKPEKSQQQELGEGSHSSSYSSSYSSSRSNQKAFTCEELAAKDPDLLKTSCAKAEWKTAKYCQKSCFKVGAGYAGDNCGPEPGGTEPREPEPGCPGPDKCWCKLRCPEGQRRSAAGTWCEAGAGKPKCDLGHCGGRPESGMAKCDMAAAAQSPAPPSDGASKRCYLYANGIEKLSSAGAGAREKQLQRKNLKNELQQENLLQVGDGRRRRRRRSPPPPPVTSAPTSAPTTASPPPPPVTSAPTSAPTTASAAPTSTPTRSPTAVPTAMATKDPSALGPGKACPSTVAFKDGTTPPQTSADQCTEAPSGQKYMGVNLDGQRLCCPPGWTKSSDGSACDLKADAQAEAVDAQAEAETVAAAAVRDKQGPDADGWMMHFDKMAKCSASEREVSIGRSPSAEACLSAVKALGAMTNLAIWRGDFDGPECFACDKTGSPSSYPGAFEEKKKAVTMYDNVARTPTPTASPTTTPTRMPTTSSPTAAPTKAPTTQLTPAPTPANDASANDASTSTTRQPSASWPTERAIEASIGATILKAADDAFALATDQGATMDLAATAAGEAAGKAVLQKPQNSFSSAAGASFLGEAAGNSYFLAAAVSAMITKQKGGSITAQQSAAAEIIRAGGGTDSEAAAAANDVATAAASVGTVPIQAGTTPKMGYYKFRVTPLRPGERLTGSTLSLKKLAGPESVCTVKLTSCTYDSTALSGANKPQVLEEVTKSGSLFPVGNGQVTLDLKSDIVKGALKRVRVADPKICVEVSGGVPEQQVLIQDVHLNLMVNRSDAALPDDKIPAPVTILRRRRHAAKKARRRSIRATLKEARAWAKERWVAKAKLYNESSDAALEMRMPILLMKKIRRIRSFLVNESETEQAEKLVTALVFVNETVDKKKRQLEKFNGRQAKMELQLNLATKSEEVEATLAKHMEKSLKQKVRSEQERIRNAEATQMADNMVAKDSAAMLHAAAVKKARADYSALMKDHIERVAPKDYTAAINAAVVKSVAEKSKAAVDKAVNDEIQKRLKLKEQMVASEAATVAINKKVAELVKQKIQEEIQREKTSGSALGMKLDSSNQGTKMAATKIIADRVARSKPPLSDSEKKEIEKLAATQAVSQLKTQITTQANVELRNPEFVNNVIQKLKKVETVRLAPIVKADIVKEIEKKDGKTIMDASLAVSKKFTNKNKDTMLKTLHVALIKKMDNDLTPQMNKKIAEEVPMEMASPKYEAKLQARQLEEVEKLKKQMLKAEMRKLETQSTRDVNLLYKERVEKVKIGIKAKANVKLANNIKAATVNRTLIAQIKSEVVPGIEMKNKERITREIRAEAEKRFALKLRDAIKAKYDTEKLYNSSVKEVEKRTPELRAQVTAQATAKAEKEAGMQIVNAQSKLRAELLQKLRKDFLLKAKVKEAAEVKHATNGLSQMKAKAVENDMHMALKQKANDYAEKQVEVQLAGKSAEQKEKMLKEIIAMKAKARVHLMLAELIKDRAKKRVAVKLNQYYEDNLDKIASSDPLVAGNPSNVTDHEKPWEGPNLKKAESQVNAPVVELGSVLDSAAEISATEVATAEGRVDVNL